MTKTKQDDRAIRQAIIWRIAALKEKRAEAAKMDQEIRKEQAEIDRLREELEQLTSKRKSLHVTDHAVVQFLSRKIGLDIDEIKHQILGTTEPITLPNGLFPVGEHRIRVVDGSVVTVIVEVTDVD